MPKPLLLWVALGIGAALSPAAEPVNQLTLSLPASAEHPRNSEGAFATLRSGRIIFCYSQFSEGSSDFSPSGIAEITSDDEGRTWSAPQVMFRLAGDAQEMSVSLLRLASGKLALFSLIKHGELECRPYLRISTDEGAHWSEARPLFSAPGYFGINNDRVIQTSRGRLVAPVAYHRTLPSHHAGTSATDLRAIALWYYSDDEGATWTESKTWWTPPPSRRPACRSRGWSNSPTARCSRGLGPTKAARTNSGRQMAGSPGPRPGRPSCARPPHPPESSACPAPPPSSPC